MSACHSNPSGGTLSYLNSSALRKFGAILRLVARMSPAQVELHRLSLLKRQLAVQRCEFESVDSLGGWGPCGLLLKRENVSPVYSCPELRRLAAVSVA